MKKLAFSVLAAVLLVSACKKDDNDAASSFKLDKNAAVATPYGFIQDYGVDGNDISFATYNPSVDTSFTGKGSYLQFSLETLTPGTYTYFSNDSAGYDAAKNFDYAAFLLNGDIKKGQPDESTGTFAEKATGGSITMKKDGEIYTFTYAIAFGTSTVSGTYVGKPLYTKEN
jgi:hypothetical protein